MYDVYTYRAGQDLGGAGLGLGQGRVRVNVPMLADDPRRESRVMVNVELYERTDVEWYCLITHMHKHARARRCDTRMHGRIPTETTRTRGFHNPPSVICGPFAASDSSYAKYLLHESGTPACVCRHRYTWLISDWAHF